MACTSKTRSKRPRRMLKKARLLTRPTLARQDAPFPNQGRSERPKMILPSLLVYYVDL
jgi:hypothetical protein